MNTEPQTRQRNASNYLSTFKMAGIIAVSLAVGALLPAWTGLLPATIAAAVASLAGILWAWER